MFEYPLNICGRQLFALVVTTFQNYVCSQDVLTAGEGPAMHVVDVVNFWNLLNPLCDLFCINVFWRELHENWVAVLGNINGSREYDDREPKRDNGVEDNPIGVEQNDYSCNNDTNWLDQVANHVDHGCAHIQITIRFFVLTWLSRCNAIVDVIGTRTFILFWVAPQSVAVSEGEQVYDVAA